MKPLESVLAASVLALGCFVGAEMISTPATAVAVVATDTKEGTLTKRLVRAAPTRVSTPAATGGVADGRVVPAELLRRIERGAEGTYIDELLTARDSALMRWADRTARPVRVFIAESSLDGWDDEYIGAIQGAFYTWSDLGIPVHFSFVRDSASADVRVSFRADFPTGISGKTVWSRDARWWLLSGEIELALAHPGGGYVDVSQMRAIALHEVGHLLGLDHTASSEHIMAAKVRVRDLSDADRATVRLLYSVPAGPLR
jgi:predicted Zn-dependent protease